MSGALLSIAVPATAHDVLSVPSPVVGGDDDAEGTLAYLDLVQCESAAYRAEVAHGASAMDELRGRAIRAATGRLGRLDEGAYALHQSAEQAFFAVRDYSGSILELHARARLLLRRVDAALAIIRGAASEIAELSENFGAWAEWGWRIPPPPDPPRSEVPCFGGPGLGGASLVLGDAILREIQRERWTLAARRWRDAVEEVDAASREWHTIVEERRAAEWTLARILESTEVGRVVVSGAGGEGGASHALARTMMIAFTSDRPWERRDVQSLIGGALSAEAAAAAWGRLAEAGVDLDPLLERYCFELANVDGIPFWARDRAGRIALEYALESEEHTLEAFRRMGFTRGEHSLITFASELSAVRDGLREAESMARPAMLAGLGRHDGAVTAGISFGDLDSSPTVGVFVSGMRSDVTQLDDAFEAFEKVQGNQPEMALVTWIGYRAPGIAGEILQDRAERGRFVLADFLVGISAARAEEPLERLVLMAHSYGSNVAAEALKLGDARVDAFVTIGSAGLSTGTTREQLQTSEVYATHANGDNIALIGQAVHLRSADDGGGLYEPRVDPRDLSGAQVFSSEESTGGRAVTMHNLVHPIDWGPFQWVADLDGHAQEDEVGYLNRESSTVDRIGEIMEGELK